VLAFQGFGILYAWGVIQAHLAEKNLASPILLSVIGATSAFWVAFSCLPVSFSSQRNGMGWDTRTDPDPSLSSMRTADFLGYQAVWRSDRGLGGYRLCDDEPRPQWVRYR
jgi:hypothetical protein